MRIASANAFESSLGNLQRRQQALAESQDKLTSGLRVMRPSDDPAAVAAAERARATLSTNTAQKRALDASRGAMQMSESALGNAGDLMATARDIVIAAGNGTYGDSERVVLAQSLRSVRNDLLAVANRSDGAGRYLFGGQGSDGRPLLDAPGGVVFNGTPGQQQTAGGESSPMSIDGRAAWLLAPDPANPGATLSVFDTLDSTINALLTPGITGAQLSQTVSQGLAGIDAVAQNLSSWRSRAGESLNRIDGIQSRLSQAGIDAEQQRSDAEDLDMLSAISDFKNRQSGYDAALQTYSLVQRMSLFDYLK